MSGKIYGYDALYNNVNGQNYYTTVSGVEYLRCDNSNTMSRSTDADASGNYTYTPSYISSGTPTETTAIMIDDIVNNGDYPGVEIPQSFFAFGQAPSTSGLGETIYLAVNGKKVGLRARDIRNVSDSISEIVTSIIQFTYVVLSTIYTDSALENHADDHGKNDGMEGGNDDYYYEQITGSNGSGQGLNTLPTTVRLIAISSADFSREAIATVNNITYYRYDTVYVTQGTSQSSTIRLQRANDIDNLDYGTSNASARVLIANNAFASGELPSAGDIIYFNTFNDGEFDYQVALQRMNTDYSTSMGGTAQFEFVSSSNDPICLTDTCDILTPNGYVNVKDLSVGDLVTTPEGKNVKITKVMKPTTHVAMGKALPHFIPKNSLGENKPSKDTFISKNHAYNSGDEWLCGQFNIEHNAINWDQDFVTYYNIMTEDYPKHTLVVNGVEMESWGGYEHNKPETHGNIKLRREKLGFK